MRTPHREWVDLSLWRGDRTSHNRGGLQHGDELIRGLEAPGAQLRRDRRFERLQFYSRVSSRVDFRRLNAGVAKPERDLSQVFGGLENGHGAGVSQDVGRYSLR